LNHTSVKLIALMKRVNHIPAMKPGKGTLVLCVNAK